MIIDKLHRKPDKLHISQKLVDSMGHRQKFCVVYSALFLRLSPMYLMLY